MLYPTEPKTRSSCPDADDRLSMAHILSLPVPAVCRPGSLQREGLTLDDAF